MGNPHILVVAMQSYKNPCHCRYNQRYVHERLSGYVVKVPNEVRELPDTKVTHVTVKQCFRTYVNFWLND